MALSINEGFVKLTGYFLGKKKFTQDLFYGALAIKLHLMLLTKKQRRGEHFSH
jgi:hypothetical protein